MRRAAIYALGFTLAVYAALYAQTITPGSGGSGGSSGSSVSITTGTYANLPASGTSTGDTYFFTDALYDRAVWDGSAWEYFVGGMEVTVPPSTGWSWANQGTSTIATTNGTQVLEIPASASNSIRMRVRTLPSAPYTITMAMSWMSDYANFSEAGICLRNSGTSTVSLYGVLTPHNSYYANKWTNETTFSSVYTVNRSAQAPERNFVLLRLADNSTNRIFSASFDHGMTWTTLYTVSNTDFHTPDQIGFYSNVTNSYPALVSVFHWLEE